MKARLSHVACTDYTDDAQEYAECQADTPAGITINFDEQNITKWEVVMDGPEQSIYAVRLWYSNDIQQLLTALRAATSS